MQKHTEDIEITVQLGTLMGVSELFFLMGEGGDPRFLDYFSRLSCTKEESQAFREFLFGLSTETLASLNTAIMHGDRSMCDRMDITRSFDPSAFDEHSVTEFVSRFYMFFVKRHMEALLRRVSDMEGPKRTAEEYVMIYFLKQTK